MIILAAIGGLNLQLAQGQEPEDPDLDFLEYLGSWQGDDDEWLIAAELEQAKTKPPPVDGKPEAETDDDDE